MSSGGRGELILKLGTKASHLGHSTYRNPNP
ncbi:hypothetical protein EJ110_NYTH19733 [Nymphaea thermarum]|nr:hypothetical protein EJ110_NYTH19733 [Nymphaea thermarum]